MRNALYAIEGPDMTRFACETCHNVGQPRADGSVGQCQKCHLRHEFSLEQARKPETCNACHIGPDHPQWEIYQESPHGIAYATGGDRWNWEAEAGTLTVKDFPAATCAICHMSGFGAPGTTHDVGDRLTWYLFAPISERRPILAGQPGAHAGRLPRVPQRELHRGLLRRGRRGHRGGQRLGEARATPSWSRSRSKGLLTAEPFDEPIDFTYFELWHHWGRTAKFGAWMQGPDYTQWHGDLRDAERPGRTEGRWPPRSWRPPRRGD